MQTIRRLVACTILILAVAACGDDDDHASSGPSAPSTAPASTTTSESSSTDDPVADTAELSTYFIDGDGHIRVRRDVRCGAPTVAAGVGHPRDGGDPAGAGGVPRDGEQDRGAGRDGLVERQCDFVC